MQNNYFSIIIPLYNMENYIKSTLESVLNQTYINYEIIVVNDGSTDNSVDVVSKLNNPKIKLLNKANGGVSSARNLGIKHAQYEYIGFLDADDTWSPLFLETMNLMINNYPLAGAYATGFKLKYKNGNEINPLNIKKIKSNYMGYFTDYFKYSFNSPVISSSTVVIPKSTFEHIGTFDPSLNRGEDKKMWDSIALEYKICFTSKVLAYYYIEASTRRDKERYDYHMSFMNYADLFFEKNKNKPYASKYFRRNMNNYKILNAKYALYAGDKHKAKEIFCNLKKTYFVLPNFWKLIVFFLKDGVF